MIHRKNQLLLQKQKTVIELLLSPQNKYEFMILDIRMSHY